MEKPEGRDYRAQFDFDIEFSNGGGVQGQEFRIDIAGDSISDEELAAAIVQDLGLLMVKDVRIQNKTIVRERHKRRAVAATGPSPGNGRKRIDLSHVVEDGMITYKGIPAPVVCDFLSREDSRSHYSEGTDFQIGRIDMCANTGTYVDSPFHRYADGADLADLPLEHLADLEAITINVAGSRERAIGRSAFLPYDVGGKAVLIHTGWSALWRTDAYFEGHPFLTGEAAAHLAEEDVLLVGIDSLNIDDTNDGRRPVHSTLLAAGIPICEHLTNLDAVPSTGFRFSAVPVKVRNMGTFPVRAYATLS